MEIITLSESQQKSMYGKCSKITKTFLFLISVKNVDYLSWNSQNHVRIVNREDPDQTASSEAV